MNGPWSLEETFQHVYPTEAIGMCPKCLRLHFLGQDACSLEMVECGPDFGRGSFCDGRICLIATPPQATLLAALRIGGERAVVELLADGCPVCVQAYYDGAKYRCPVHGKRFY